MAEILGSATRAIYRNGLLATAYGTAVAGSTGDLIRVNSITPSMSSEESAEPTIGAGLLLPTSSKILNKVPGLTIDMPLGVRNGVDKMLAQFFGGAAVGTEITAGQGDYKHTLTFNSTLNRIFGTVAFDETDTTVAEYTSCAVTGFTMAVPQPQGRCNFNATLIANQRTTASSTNTTASLGSATLGDTESLTSDHDDEIWIDTQASAALSSADRQASTGWTLNLQRPQVNAREIKGTAGAGAPVATDVISGTLTIPFAKMIDQSWWTAFNAETIYKAKLSITGTQIGSGSNKSITVYLPGLQLVQAPDRALASAASNPMNLTFKIVGATSNPTGMTSLYPYIEIINTNSTVMIS